MKNLLTLATFALLAFFTSACALNSSFMPLTSQEKKVVEVLYSVFEEHNISVLQNWGTDRMIVAAKMAHTCNEKEEHMEVGHHEEHHNKEKMTIMVKKATPDPAGGYGQPTFKMGNTTFCYEELYIAIVENGTITFSKTLPVENSHLREESPLEPSIIQKIASMVEGKIKEGRIFLP